MTKDIEREETKALKKAIKELYEECDLLSEEEKDQFDSLFTRALKIGEMRERLKLEGCVVVPVEPTDEMLFAASGRDIVAEHYGDENIMWPELRENWNAMLEAARGGNNV